MMVGKEDRRLLAGIQGSGEGESVTAAEVADCLAITQQDARRLLDRLLRGFYVVNVSTQFADGKLPSVPPTYGLTGQGTGRARPTVRSTRNSLDRLANWQDTQPYDYPPPRRPLP